MSTKMKSILDRVDGLPATVTPVSVLGPARDQGRTRARKLAQQARARARDLRQGAVVHQGRLPRGLEHMLTEHDPDMQLAFQEAGLV